MKLLPDNWSPIFAFETPLLELVARGTVLYFAILIFLRLMPRRTGGELALQREGSACFFCGDEGGAAAFREQVTQFLGPLTACVVHPVEQRRKIFHDVLRPAAREPVLASIRGTETAIPCETLKDEQRGGGREACDRERCCSPGEIERFVKRRDIRIQKANSSTACSGTARSGLSRCAVWIGDKNGRLQ